MRWKVDTEELTGLSLLYTCLINTQRAKTALHALKICDIVTITHFPPDRYVHVDYSLHAVRAKEVYLGYLGINFYSWRYSRDSEIIERASN